MLKLLIFLMASIALPAAAQNLLVIEGATLIDGTGRPAVPNSVVVIRDNKIAAAGRKDEISVPAGARVIGAAGAFIIPGLIDCHIHYDAPRDLVQMIAWGVTSANCMFESTDRALEMEAHTSAATVHAPRIYTTAPIFTAEGGWWWGEGFPLDSTINRFPRSPAEAAGLIARAKAKGIKRIKLMYDDMDWCRDPLPKLTRMREDIMQALLRESRSAGLFSEVHAPKLGDALAVVEGGTSALAHGIVDKPLDSASAARIVRGGLYYIPTFCVFEFLADVEGFMKNALADSGFHTSLPDEVVRRYAGADYYAHYRTTYPNISFVRSHLPVLEANMKRLSDAGANVAMGTDMWAFPGIGAHLELEYMVRGGITPMSALRAATSMGAKFLGESASKGTVEAGKEADLLILDANPLDDIRNTRRIRSVIRGGNVFSHAELVGESKR